MSQTDLLLKVAWNGFKAFVTAVILVLAFIKTLEMITKYSPLVNIQIVFVIIFSLSLYYYYFWTGHKDLGMIDKDDPKLVAKDFVYTDKMDTEKNTIALVCSFIGGAIIEAGILLAAYVIKYCIDNSGSEGTMSLLRIVVIGVIATTLYLYTQRKALEKNFLGTIAICTVYGFSLSLIAYLLGMIIGISNMVFGVPITVAILVLQFAFTSIYTYSDLLEWSKYTHKVEVQEKERAEKKAQEEAAKAAEKPAEST